jgi:hypothetical protein
MSKREREVMREAHQRAKRALAAISQQEDATILKAAATDPDAQPPTDEMLRRLRPAIDVAPQIVRQARGQRGRKGM